MASFDATSSAVPDSLLLARQADRLARQATNTVMQDTISRPALGDSSNTLSVEALVKHCLLYTSPSPRDGLLSRMPSSA